MTATRAERRFVSWTIAAIVAVLFIAAVTSCAGLRKTLWISGGAAGGALVGGPVGGPLGAATGAALGGGATHAIVENQELRDGTITGEDALAAENDRLHKVIAQLGGKVAQYEGGSLLDWATASGKTLLKWCLVLLVGWALGILLLTPRGWAIAKTIKSPLSFLAAMGKAVGMIHTSSATKAAAKGG